MLLAPLGVCCFGFLADLIERSLKYHTQINIGIVSHDRLDLASIFLAPVAFSL